MVTAKNDSKTWAKDTWCKCKCKFDARKFKSNQKLNIVKCRCECEKHQICEKEYIWNPATCSCKNRKHLASMTQ